MIHLLASHTPSTTALILLAAALGLLIGLLIAFIRMRRAASRSADAPDPGEHRGGPLR